MKKDRRNGKKLYTLAIADDEQMMRNGLTKSIDWEELGYELTECFSDGGEVIEAFQKEIPDVLLCDIRMVAVSGIEVLRFIHEKQLPVKVVLLSGYGEFEYAQSAVEYKAERYLLKPISIPRLEEVFRQIYGELKKNDEFADALQEQSENHRVLVTYEKHRFMTDLYMGLLTEQEIERRLKMTGAENLQTAVLVSVEVVHDEVLDRFLKEYGQDCFYELLHNLLRSIWEEADYYPLEDWQYGTAGVFWENEKEGETQFSRKFRETELFTDTIGRILKEFGGFRISQAYARTTESISRLNLLLQEERKSRERKETRGIGMDAKDCITAVKQFIDKNFADDITLADAADIVYLHPIYISRIFKERTGRTFTEYLTDVRISAAAGYLEDSGYYVYEIGDLVGYHNLKYFYKIFRKKKGCTPGEYREKIKKGKGG